MKIKAKYYYPDKGEFQGSKDHMILQDRQIVSLGRDRSEMGDTKPFYYDDTNYAIAYGPQERKQKIVINRLITEAHYTTQQKEYLTRLTWLQQQKLLWMFKRHWLQQPGNMTHLLIVGIMLTLAVVGFEVLKKHL